MALKEPEVGLSKLSPFAHDVLEKGADENSDDSDCDSDLEWSPSEEAACRKKLRRDECELAPGCIAKELRLSEVSRLETLRRPGLGERGIGRLVPASEELTSDDVSE